MEEKTIMLVCSAGMSTSMLVQKMQEVAEVEGKKFEIFAVAASEARDQLERRKIDALLLGPQVKYMKNQFDELGEKHSVPVDVINMQDYGMFNGSNVLESAEKLMKDFNG